MVNCPCHDDSTPSLHLSERNGQLLWHCHAGCSQERVWRTLLELAGHSRPSRGRSETRHAPSRTSHTENRPESPSSEDSDAPSGCTLAQLAREKMLAPTLLRDEWRVEDGQYRGRSAVKIPHYAENGELLGTLWRVGLTEPRFRREEQSALYGLWRLPQYNPTEPLWVAEGATDCWTLSAIGLQVVGLPSTSVGERIAETLWAIAERFSEIILALDSDEAGERALRELANSCFEELLPRTCVVQPTAKDWNELWRECNADASQFRARLESLPRTPLAEWREAEQEPEEQYIFTPIRNPHRAEFHLHRFHHLAGGNFGRR